jgi:geranylgeranyl diphosphate synthase type II
MCESASSDPTCHANPLCERIEAALDHYSCLGPDCPPRLQEAIRYSLLAPGKRLRPQIVLLAAQVCGGDIEPALPAACAVEMVHTYSLVHDDLPAMDDDDLRRGRPTCHRQFDEATAILVGDALLTRAFEIVALDVKPPAVALSCVSALAAAAGGTALVGGQADDLAGRDGGPPANDRATVLPPGDQLAALEAIHDRKTGAMFGVSLQLGGRIAGGSEADLAALDAFGRPLGLAFQIIDDLLDVEGEEAVVGKRLRKDDRQGKMTFPALLGTAESRRRAGRLIRQAKAALERFGSDGRPLAQLADFILARSS